MKVGRMDWFSPLQGFQESNSNHEACVVRAYLLSYLTSPQKPFLQLPFIENKVAHRHVYSFLTDVIKNKTKRVSAWCCGPYLYRRWGKTIKTLRAAEQRLGERRTHTSPLTRWTERYQLKNISPLFIWRISGFSLMHQLANTVFTCIW